MAKEVSVVAENVKIQDFEKIQERIRQYISYCFPGNQPVDSTAVFYYELEEMSFGYTYIPAYENPIMCGQSRRGSWNLEAIIRNRSWTEGRKRRLLPGFL